MHGLEAVSCFFLTVLGMRKSARNERPFVTHSDCIGNAKVSTQWATLRDPLNTNVCHADTFILANDSCEESKWPRKMPVVGMAKMAPIIACQNERRGWYILCKTWMVCNLLLSDRFGNAKVSAKWANLRKLFDVGQCRLDRREVLVVDASLQFLGLPSHTPRKLTRKI